MNVVLARPRRIGRLMCGQSLGGRVGEWKVRRRKRLKRKEAEALRQQLERVFGGGTFWGDDAAVETADAGDHHVILVDNEVYGLIEEDVPFLSVRGLLAYRPQTRYVTVDMGAVRFVHNGADIMAPGITEADPALAEGDWCWVRDEKNGQPLAVGRCLVAGPVMAGGEKGKAVASVHFIGDKLWELEG